MSAAPIGRSSAIKLVIRFCRCSPQARIGVSRMKGAPKVARESKAPPAQTENRSSARVSARPSACRERKAKKVRRVTERIPKLWLHCRWKDCQAARATGTRAQTRAHTRYPATHGSTTKAETNARHCLSGLRRQTTRRLQRKTLKRETTFRAPPGKRDSGEF